MMIMACRLKIKYTSNKEDNTRVDEILSSLSLSHRKESTADTLSGGERKRLSIALELVTNPSIMFLDEPTSGLDEVTAASCIRLLKSLAHQDKTIICTIHQPSAAMFAQFDNVYLLARGQCVYQGSPKTFIPFLISQNFECPKYNNPADYSKFSSKFYMNSCIDINYSIIPIFFLLFFLAFAFNRSNWTLWYWTWIRHSKIFRNLWEWKASVPTRILAGWRVELLRDENFNQQFSHRRWNSTAGVFDFLAKVETIVKVFQERICTVEFSAVSCASADVYRENSEESNSVDDSTLPSHRLWTLHRLDFLQCCKWRRSNVWPSQILHGRNFLRSLHTNYGADSAISAGAENREERMLQSMVFAVAVLSRPHVISYAIPDSLQLDLLVARVFPRRFAAWVWQILHVCTHRNYRLACLGRSWIVDRSDVQCDGEFWAYERSI